MPIEPTIDLVQRIVFARAWGVLTDQDVFSYQRQVWSRPEVAGFHELVDMSEVEHIIPPSPTRIMELANLSAFMDKGSTGSRMAIVATSPLAYGLGRMYQVYRGTNEVSTKEVQVFRQRDAALHWLATGIKINNPEAFP